MIICFEGLQGEGKTASAILVARLFSEVSNKPIYSNSSIIGAKKISTINEFYHLENSIIVFDEMHLNCDSRKYAVNTDFTYIITQQRKRKNVLLFTTQYIEMVDNRVRENTHYLFRCQQQKEQQQWLIYPFLDLYFHRNVKPVIKRFSNAVLQKYAFPFYDTYELIRPLS